jgi:phosphoglycerol transferase MdoB-like AlkP superfamily enzyme
LNSVYKSTFSSAIRAVLVLLMGDFLLRVVFFWYNRGAGWDYEGRDVPLSLLVGVRFDLATIAILNGWVLLWMALPLSFVVRRIRQLNLLLVIIHLPVLLLNATDVVYFGFSGKRLSHEFFTGGKDLANFSVTDLLPYWWLLLLVFSLSWGEFWLLNRTTKGLQLRSGNFWVQVRKWAAPVLMVGLLLLAFRGGFQRRPMRPANAFATSSLFLGNVSLNSAYTVIQSLEIGNEPDVELMPMAEAVEASRELVRNDFDGPFKSEDYPLLRDTHFDGPERRLNVVILIIESLNASKIGCIRGQPLTESLTPHLDTLARHGRVYTNFYSNGSRSVQSLPAIFNSTPDLFERPVIGSSFETNQIWGIGNMLKSRGYHTSFVCGGHNGTMGFDSYSMVSGFDHYYGRNQYPGDASISGNWGIHDHSTLSWLADLQDAFPQPFLNAWFSISNHHPFDLPADCPAQIAQSGISPMDKTVRYTDWAVGQYFRRIAKTAWAANTVFVITGDHCFYFADDPDRGDVQNFHVPLFLIAPGLRPGMADRVGSHISILPTLIELLRLRTAYAGVGVSMFSQRNEPFSLASVMGILSLSRKRDYLSTTLEKILGCYQYVDGKWVGSDALRQSPEGQSLLHSLRAIYQVCSWMRKHNRQNLMKGMEDVGRVDGEGL